MACRPCGQVTAKRRRHRCILNQRLARSLLPLLLSLCMGGCHHSPGPVAPPERPFHSDGCSCFPDLDYGDCCTDHDRRYWWGGTPGERRAADESLRRCIAAKGRPLLSHLVFWGVRVGGHGWLPTPWRWGFGRTWPEGYASEPSPDAGAFGNASAER